MIDEVMSSIAPRLRTATMRGDIEQLIFVRTWGSESFEFADFTDTEIAVGSAASRRGAVPNLVLLSAMSPIADLRAAT